jgi:hypothetical protein
VPEPATLGLVIGGMAMVVRWRGVGAADLGARPTAARRQRREFTAFRRDALGPSRRSRQLTEGGD